MSQKWNLQDIRPPESRKRRKVPGVQAKAAAAGEKTTPNSSLRSKDDIPSIVIEDGRKKDTKRLIISIILFVVIVGSAIGLSSLLGKTEVTVYPKFKQPNINAEFTAYPDKRDGELSYEVMTLESTGERQVKATGQVEVEEQATGVIEIVKTTPGAERLIKNTRFRTKDGLIFRIKESVVVPGVVKNADGKLVPGTIRAEAFADDVGEEYNVPLGTTFDIPGFQENGYDALYKAITGRVAEPFTGGFKGPQYKVDETEMAKANQELEKELRDGLLARIDNEKPAGYIAYKDAVAITYNDLPAVKYKDGFVTVKKQAILQLPMFKNTDLGSYLAEKSVPTYDGGKVRIDNPDTLTFSYTSPTTSTSVIANEPSLTFKLVGKPLLIWVYDKERLLKNLAGKPKTAAYNIRQAYPALEGISISITPFWKQTLPESPEDIKIIEKLKDPNQITQ